MNFLAISAVSGGIVVLLGAFGAHGLKDVLDTYGKSIYDKAVLYQMFHTLSILCIGIMEKIMPELQLQIAGLSFLLGILIFSGSLYLLALTNLKFLGMITPIGGLFFIIGWIILFVKVL